MNADKDQQSNLQSYPRSSAFIRGTILVASEIFMRNEKLGVEAMIVPNWPAAPSVHAVVTTRAMPGWSSAPFDQFNLGMNSGDNEHAVLANRASLVPLLELPAAPRWLRQVHGTVVRAFAVSTDVAIEPPDAGCIDNARCRHRARRVDRRLFAAAGLFRRRFGNRCDSRRLARPCGRG